VSFEGDDLKKSHKVQSHRGLIERMFARLKKWQVLFGNLVDSIDTKEKELDCAMALQNLIELDRMELLDMIPARPLFAPGCHIITPDLEPSMKFPAGVKLASDKVPPHLRAFHTAMSSIALRIGSENVFSERVVKRGDAKFLGGNVLQFQVQQQLLDQWWVRASVGASMKAPVYKCYFVLDRNKGVTASCCECKNG
jgi:hypothetical protein